ncbi:unnamed protein product [Rangifer tarandus platyrhynchus]|uniref:Uncharacterized protein n=1 Tax=Rangifer tarandus platyrhynchus TaxID=3082113 RepID=A0AC59Z3T3_RANTA
MVPAEKQLGKVVGQRRRKLGFLRLHQQERALGEKTLSWARPSARCLAFGHRGALPASAGPFAAAPPPAPQLQPQALRQQRGPEGGGAPRPASSIFSLGNRDVRKPCLPSTAKEEAVKKVHRKKRQTENIPEAPLLTWVIKLTPRLMEDLVTGLFPTLPTHRTAPDDFLMTVPCKPDALLSPCHAFGVS